MEAYQAVFPQQVLEKDRSICEVEALSVAVAVKLWAPILVRRRVILQSDNCTALAIFQAGRGRNSHIQVCAREIWLTCAILTDSHRQGVSGIMSLE